MTDTDATAVLTHAAALWPNGRLSDAEVNAWRASLRSVNVEPVQARAVLDAVRVDRGRRSPPIAVINHRLRHIAENEARARNVGVSATPAVALDFDQPQGMVQDALREWRQNPTHPRWAEWRARAVKCKTLVMLRASWMRWAGTAGPYN